LKKEKDKVKKKNNIWKDSFKIIFRKTKKKKKKVFYKFRLNRKKWIKTIFQKLLKQVLKHQDLDAMLCIKDKMILMDKGLFLKKLQRMCLLMLR
jgi:hypothetical protein